MLVCSRQVGAFSSGCMEPRYRGGGSSVPCFGSRAETSVTLTEEVLGLQVMTLVTSLLSFFLVMGHLFSQRQCWSCSRHCLPKPPSTDYQPLHPVPSPVPGSGTA